MTPPVKLRFSLLVIILGVPIVSNLNILMPYSNHYFFKNDIKYFNAFWLSVIFIQLSAFIISIKLLRANKLEIFAFKKQLNNKDILRIYSIAILLCILTTSILEFLSQNRFNSCIGLGTLDKRIIFVFSLVNAGICEEFVFRSFCFKFLSELRVSRLFSILISASVFTFYHTIFVLPNFPQYFIFGILMGLLYLWKNNVVHCMIIHISYNLFTIFYCFL